MKKILGLMLVMAISIACCMSENYVPTENLADELSFSDESCQDVVSCNPVILIGDNGEVITHPVEVICKNGSAAADVSFIDLYLVDDSIFKVYDETLLFVNGNVSSENIVVKNLPYETNSLKVIFSHGKKRKRKMRLDHTNKA